MTLEQNKALVRRYIELVDKAELAGIDEVVAPDVIDHYPAPGQALGIEGLRRTLVGFRSAFPDLHIVLDNMVAEGNIVVAWGTWRGTHKGHFMGVLPTGRQFTMPVIGIFRILGGKITDRWFLADQLGLIEQLKAMAA